MLYNEHNMCNISCSFPACSNIQYQPISAQDVADTHCKLTAGEKWWRGRWKKLLCGRSGTHRCWCPLFGLWRGVLTAPHCVTHRSEGQRPARRLGSPLSTHHYFTSDTFICWLASFRTQHSIESSHVLLQINPRQQEEDKTPSIIAQEALKKAAFESFSTSDQPPSGAMVTARCLVSAHLKRHVSISPLWSSSVLLVWVISYTACL